MSDYRDDRGQLRTRLAEAEAQLASRDAELELERRRSAELAARLAERGDQIERLREEKLATVAAERPTVAKRRRTIGLTLIASAGVAAVLAMGARQPPTGQVVMLVYALVAGVIGLIFVTQAF